MRFTPQDPAVREAFQEFERRRAEGNPPRQIGAFYCHNKAFARMWDLGVGRSLVICDTQRFRPALVGGGQPARRADEIWTQVIAFMPESDGAHAIKMHCSEGHGVFVQPSPVLASVGDYRRGRHKMLRFSAQRLSVSGPVLNGVV